MTSVSRGRARASVLAGMLLLASTLQAAPLAVGDTMPPLALEDQHGKPGVVDDAARLLVVSGDMDAGDVVKTALADRDQAFLDARGAVYVANISAMPAMITRLFALPKMRERPYRMLLDRDGKATSAVPSVPGKPTILVLDQRRIIRITHPDTPTALITELTP